MQPNKAFIGTLASSGARTCEGEMPPTMPGCSGDIWVKPPEPVVEPVLGADNGLHLTADKIARLGGLIVEDTILNGRSGGSIAIDVNGIMLQVQGSTLFEGDVFMPGIQPGDPDLSLGVDANGNLVSFIRPEFTNGLTEDSEGLVKFGGFLTGNTVLSINDKSLYMDSLGNGLEISPVASRLYKMTEDQTNYLSALFHISNDANNILKQNFVKVSDRSGEYFIPLSVTANGIDYIADKTGKVDLSAIANTSVGGVYLFEYNYSNNNIPPPSSGTFRTNSTTPFNATKIWVHRTDYGGTDRKPLLLGADTGLTFYVQDKNNADNYARYKVIGDAVDQGTYVEVTVEMTESNGSLTGNNRCLVGPIVGAPPPVQPFPKNSAEMANLIDDETGIGKMVFNDSPVFAGNVNIATVVAGTWNGSPITDTYIASALNWNAAYSWGNHATQGYLKTESDPVFAASPAFGITSTDIANWNASIAVSNLQAVLDAGATLTKANTISTGTNKLTINGTGAPVFEVQRDISTNAIVTGLSLINTVAAAGNAGGDMRYSPALIFVGQGWKGSNTRTEWGIYNQPNNGSPNARTDLVFYADPGSGTKTNMLVLRNQGNAVYSAIFAGSISCGTISSSNITSTGNISSTTYLSSSPTTVDSNFYVSGTNAGTTNVADLVFGGATNVFYRTGFKGGTVSTPSVGYGYGSVIIGVPNNVAINSSGVHPVFANLVVKALAVTGGTGSANVATAYIEGATTPVTGMVNSYAFWVDGASALSRFSGNVQIDGTITVSTYSKPQITITTAVSIDTTTTVGTLTQSGRNVVIDNGVNNINYTINALDGFCTSFIKAGTGAVTFVAGAGRTIVQMTNTLLLNGIAGSTAAIISIGTTDFLYITNY